MPLNDEPIGVMESFDWMEPCAVRFPTAPSGKHEQSALVRTIGARLREARELNNLSQSEAARQLGYANPSKLSKVESATDTNSVPLWLVVSAARVYEVSVDFLVGLTDDWEVGVPRGTQGWLLDAWQKVRLRDIGLLDRVHHEVVAVAGTTTELVAAVREVGDVLTAYRDRNPGFDETPASNALVSRIAKLEAVAKRADAGLMRFELGKHRRAA